MAKLTYSDLWSDFRDNTGNPGSSDATLSAFFDRHLQARYDELLADFSNFTTQPPPQTATTSSSQQYYHKPPGVVEIENVYVDIGDQNIPLQVVNSQKVWDELNYISISSWPTHIFPRRDDFGLWPVPDDTYTINFSYSYRDRALTTADFTSGTVTVTNDDTTITHSATGFTALMVGRWFKVDQDGHWYRIKTFTDTSNMELETVYEGSSGSGLNFVIGECPELPDEVHIALSYGVAADYFAGPRKDHKTALWWESKYNEVVKKAKKKYASRSNKRLVKRNIVKKANAEVNFLWSKTLTA